jgi:ABC-2 type transport system permease protein
LEKLVFNMAISLDVLSVIMIIAESVMFSGMGMMLSRVVKEAEAAAAAANAVTFPMMFLSGTFFPIEIMPDFLKPVAKALPLTYVNDGLRASMVFGNFEQAVVNTAIITVLGIICIIVGAVVTKWEEE